MPFARNSAVQLEPMTPVPTTPIVLMFEAIMMVLLCVTILKYVSMLNGSNMWGCWKRPGLHAWSITTWLFCDLPDRSPLLRLRNMTDTMLGYSCLAHRSTLRSGKGITLAGRDLRLKVHELMDNETLSRPNAGDDMRHVLAKWCVPVGLAQTSG